ncbi:MAG: response regulator transcription factor [Aquabacterium sp.]|jgi:DNA-binding LytR/AlgR family response regulator|nr:MAG: response regulator transcription factor [Aquabacterium sp.]TAL15442.1 MAG: response regulator transcription factor [Aquabacterium sp.]
MTRPTALIAEDEPLLAQGLQAELALAWPQLLVRECCGDGRRAVERALALQPDLLFLDIRMPELDGLQAAQAVAEDWPAGAPLPLIVFVTAYDEYALSAFQHAAADYLLKPVSSPRLQLACARLRERLQERQRPAWNDEAMGELRRLLAGLSGLEDNRPAPARLKLLQASGAGGVIHVVPVDEVVYFEAADKYVRVLTAQREHLLRTSLRELLPALDGEQFWQVHRGTIVRASAIERAVRDEGGRLWLHLRGRAERLAVSRLHAHLFKAM